VTTPYEENPEFVGRVDILQEIHSELGSRVDGSPTQRTFALAGLGGMGKTQIAVEYTFRFRDAYDVILWAHADGQAKLAECFCQFAVELGLLESETASPAIAKEAVKDCLRTLGISSLHYHIREVQSDLFRR
jgi:hypothetical protein